MVVLLIVGSPFLQNRGDDDGLLPITVFHGLSNGHANGILTIGESYGLLNIQLHLHVTS